MVSKTVFVVFCATLAVSTATQIPSSSNVDDGIVKTLLGSTTNVIKEIAKVATTDADKYAVDLNELYKKYGLEEKANWARNYLQTQFKRGIELTNDYIKQKDISEEEEFKKKIESIKKVDAAFAEKMQKFYEKMCEIDRLGEDIVKYVLDADKAASLLRPFEQNLIETIKKVESAAIETIKKGGQKLQASPK